MKKIILSTFILSLLSLSTFSQVGDASEKAFKKGNFTISVGAAAAGYKTEVTQEYDSVYWDGTSLQTVRANSTDSDGAVSVIFPLSLEYGLTNWLGIGARVGYSKYLAAADSTNANVRPKVSSFDVDGLVNLHFVKTKRFDMPLCIAVGYSNFTYKSLDSLESKAKDGGLNMAISIAPRIYFGEHVGMYFDLGYAAYSYPSMTFSNSMDSNVNQTNNQKFALKGKGVTFGLGLMFKF